MAIRRLALAYAQRLHAQDAVLTTALANGTRSLQQQQQLLGVTRGIRTSAATAEQQPPPAAAAQQQQQQQQQPADAPTVDLHEQTREQWNRPLHVPKPQPQPQSFAAVPRMAKLLGMGGALPFIALSPPVAAAIPLMPDALVASSALLQLGYGAGIASFLGGVHWGLATAGADFGAGRAAVFLATNERLMWSVTPCLLAWPAVAMDAGPGALVMGGTLALCYGIDRAWWRRGLLPGWYMALRLPLTLLATAGLGTTVVHSLMQEQQQAAAYAAAAAKERQQEGED